MFLALIVFHTPSRLYLYYICNYIKHNETLDSIPSMVYIWAMPVTPALSRWTQADQEFKVILSYTVKFQANLGSVRPPYLKHLHKYINKWDYVTIALF